MVSGLEQLLTNLLHVGGDHHKIPMGETNHDIAIAIPTTELFFLFNLILYVPTTIFQL